MKKNSFVLPFLAAFVLAACSNSGDGSNPLSALAPQQDAEDNGKMSYMTFGSWPQTIKAANVTVNENEKETHGAFVYCKGSDGEWYVKILENACESNLKYSDGTVVANKAENSYKWFKVEPIEWRVLTTDYNGTGKKLLLAKKILANCMYHDYDGLGLPRMVYTTPQNPVAVCSNNWEYSTVRAFLNGTCYPKLYGVETTSRDVFLEKGFLQTAFSAAELSKIADMSVDNSARSTNPDANATKFNKGANPYASDTPTTDKIFLLSEQEATKSEYGFEAYNVKDKVSNARILMLTDYAKANGLVERKVMDGRLLAGFWWLRSPHWSDEEKVYAVSVNGYATGNEIISTGCYPEANNDRTGVAPALCVNN